MEQTNKLISNVLKNQTVKPSRSQVIYSEEQIAAVKYFFGKLKMTYPKEYGLNISATTKRESLIRNENAKYLANYTLDQIDKGFDFIRQQKHDGEPKYLKMDVDLCVGAVRDANKKRAAHQEYTPLPPPKQSKEERKAQVSKWREEFESV